MAFSSPSFLPKATARPEFREKARGMRGKKQETRIKKQEPRRRADGDMLRANKSADPFAAGGKRGKRQEPRNKSQDVGRTEECSAPTSQPIHTRREENGKRTCFAKRLPFSGHLVSGFWILVS
jgi:hypothetical protein